MTLVEIISSQLIMMATNRIKGTPKLSQHATLEEMSFLLSPKTKTLQFYLLLIYFLVWLYMIRIFYFLRIRIRIPFIISQQLYILYNCLSIKYNSIIKFFMVAKESIYFLYFLFLKTDFSSWSYGFLLFLL